jgi:predicted HAD superfamily phosphohydrolase
LRFQKKKKQLENATRSTDFAMANAFIQTLSFGKRRRRILLVVRQNQSPPNNKIRILNHQPLRMMLQVRERERERERERIHIMVAPKSGDI